MAFMKLLLAFAPWLAFLIIAQDTLFRVKLGLVVALVLSVVMGLTRLHRGIILWAGLLFFSGATLAIVVLENLWTLRHMGILANGILAASTWFTISLKQPFTLDYAKAQTDPSQWGNRDFIRSNYIISSIWGTTFTVNAGLALLKMRQVGLPALAYEMISYLFLVGTALFTVWYPKHLRARTFGP